MSKRDGVSSEEQVAALAVRGLVVSYGRVRVVHGIDVTVGDAQCVGLLGTNGAGKSTVLKAVAGLIRPERGSVSIRGKDITGREPEEVVASDVSLIQGGAATFPGMNVRDHLRAAVWSTRGSVAEAIERCGELFPALTSKLEIKAGRLSGGERQMLALAQALVRRPKLLLIDEMSLGLGPGVVAELLKVLRGQLANGVSILIAEQSINVAAALVSRAVFLERGEVRAQGTIEDLRRAEVVRAVLLR
jgi:ABC-type branched-subunit amino acid transport system ATPase component